MNDKSVMERDWSELTQEERRKFEGGVFQAWQAFELAKQCYQDKKAKEELKKNLY